MNKKLNEQRQGHSSTEVESEGNRKKEVTLWSNNRKVDAETGTKLPHTQANIRHL